MRWLCKPIKTIVWALFILAKNSYKKSNNSLISKSYYLEGSNSSEGVYSNAYTPWNIVEPAIRITHSDGNTSLDLKYVSDETKKIDDT